MPAGLNLLACIWRLEYPTDDSVGGAVSSGTLLYQDVQARVSSKAPSTVLLEQGVETISVYSGILWPGNLDVNENDQLEITKPEMSPYYGIRFVIKGVQHTSMHPSNSQGYLLVTMQRKTESRDGQHV